MVRQDIVDGKGAISFGRKKAKHVFLLRNVRNETGASEVFWTESSSVQSDFPLNNCDVEKRLDFFLASKQVGTLESK